MIARGEFSFVLVYLSLRRGVVCRVSEVNPGGKKTGERGSIRLKEQRQCQIHDQAIDNSELKRQNIQVGSFGEKLH